MSRELAELDNGEHTYSEFRVFGHHLIVLCDFCDADFGSYLPSYFGLPETGRVIDDPQMELIRELPRPWKRTEEKFCPYCQKSLQFLEFRKRVIDENKSTEPSPPPLPSAPVGHSEGDGATSITDGAAANQKVHGISRSARNLTSVVR